MSIDLVGPDGREYTLDNADPAALDEALRQGFKMPLNSAPKSDLEQAGEEVAAGAAGLAEGVTGGLFGTAVGLAAKPDKYGFADPTKRAAAKEVERLSTENPYASGAGELVGAVASPINEVGNLVRGSLKATTTLGRIGAHVAGGAPVGMLFGAGKTVSDAMLGDHDLTAEKLIAGGGLGAVLGGLGGGVGGVIEEGARAVLPRAATLAKRAQSALDDIANDAAISSTRAQQNVINRIGDDKLAQVAKVLRDRGHLQLTPDAIAESVAKDREQVGQLLGKFLDNADAAGSKADHMKMLGRLDQFEAGLNPLERDAISSDLRAARKAVAQLGEEGSGFRALDDLKQTIQAKAKFSRGPTPLDDTTLGLKRGLAGVFRDELDQQLLPQLGADAAKKFTDSKALYGALKDAERLAQSGAGRVGGVGLRDMLAAVVGSNIHPMGVAAALGSKVLRENGPAIVARIADRLAKEPAMQAIAKGFAASLPQTLPKLGQYGAVLAQEAGVSPERALAAHMAMAQLDPGYAAHAQLAGLEPETPDEHFASMGKAQTLAEAVAAVRAHDDEMRKAVDRAFRGEAAPKASSALKSQDFDGTRTRSADAYNKRVDEIRKLSTDPQALVDRVSANMAGVGGVAPGVAASMTNAAHRAVTYLANAAAVPLKAGPLAPEWDPPDSDKFDFTQKLGVVQSPMSVLDDAAAGTLTPMQMDALRAVYPRLAEQIAQTALDRMASAKGDVPYRARLMVGMLAGLDVDGTMSPEAIAANQTAIAAGSSRTDAPGAPGAPQDAKGGITLAQRSATPAQRREVRDEGTG